MNRARGFTLLEMLLAVSLLVLLAALAYGTLRLGVRGWESAGEHTDQDDALRVAWPFLHEAISGAITQRTPRGELRFDGQSQALTWIALLPSQFAHGPQELTLQLDSASQNPHPRLLLQARPPAEPDAPAQQAVLVDAVADLDIRFQAADGQWLDTWQAQRQLPQLVRVDVTPVGRAPWPPLIAHPFMAGVPTVTADNRVPGREETE